MPFGGHQVTEDDVGPAVNVVSWLMAATAFLTVGMRAVTKRSRSQFTPDDMLIFASLIFSLAFSTTNSLAVNYGLGQHYGGLSPQQRESFQKCVYIMDIFYMLVTTLSKLSILYFLKLLSPVHFHQQLIKFFTGTVILWGSTSFLVVVFQCRPPQVWNLLDRQACIKRNTFVLYSNVSNIILEIALIAFPVSIMVMIQTKTSKKLLLISCFLARALVIGALLAEIVTRVLFRSDDDPTFRNWSVVMTREITVSLSVVTACIPYYVAWVPNAFKIYANTYANSRARDAIARARTTYLRPLSFNHTNNAINNRKSSNAQHGMHGGRPESHASIAVTIEGSTRWTAQPEPDRAKMHGVQTVDHG